MGGASPKRRPFSIKKRCIYIDRYTEDGVIGYVVARFL
jgi:hypothetical protein